MKKYSIEVWDLKFYKVDAEGNALLNKDGGVKLFDAPEYDCSDLAEGIDEDTLKECKL